MGRASTNRAGRPRKPGTVLILSQVYPPDPASVGQHIADVAAETARRGYRVVVLTSNRGYDDPSVHYPWHEVRSDVHVWRLPFTSLGKSSFHIRMLAALSFICQATLIALLLPRLAGILVSTAPPLCSAAALVAHFLRRAPFLYWVMDLNPDQLIALGSLSEASRPARLFERINRAALRRAASVVALDRFMAERLQQKAALGDRLSIIAPWPHEEHLEPVDHRENPFREKHGLEDQFVLMYSGNHSASNPLDTILEAALQLKDDPGIRFVFVGGGLGKRAIEQFAERHQLPNVLSLPYQPLSSLRYSLSAADVHIVSLGEPLVGIIHPCKIYGAMATERPVLFLGPGPSHVSDVLQRHPVGWQISHGDVAGAVETIRRISTMSAQQRTSMGREARRVLRRSFSQRELCTRLCDRLEGILRGAEAPFADSRLVAALRESSEEEPVPAPSLR